MTAPGRLLDGVRRIAVLRANALGDFLVTLPAIHALHAAYEEAELVLLGTPMHAELLASRRSPVDRVEVVPPMRGIRDGAEQPALIAEFVERMRAERFDLAVQLHGGGRHSNRLIRQLGARTSVGLRAPDAEPLDRSIPYVLYHHDTLRMLEVVGLVGARTTSLLPFVEVTDGDRSAAAAVTPRGADLLAVLHPGATDPRRRWPPERFAAVGDALVGAGADVLVTGGRGEEALAGQVVSAMRAPAGNVAGQLTLSALVGVLDRAAVMVANDTGPRHLAEAVGTATVAVYWCGNLVNAGPLARARHRVHVSWRLQCPVCGASAVAQLYPARGGAAECDHEASWVTDVPLAEVLPDALDLLKG